MDVFLSSEDLEPEDNRVEYSERLVRLGRLGTFFERPVPPSGPPSPARFGLPDGRRLYACPQTLFKFHPDFDLALAEIVERDDRALIVLISGKHPNWDRLLRERFARVSESLADRTVFLPQLSLPDYLGLMQLADAVLDPFYFSGGNSSLEGFSVAAAIVTWPTELLRARITAACYGQMDLSELTASSAEDYVELALRLAMQRDFNEDSRRKIGERSHVLYQSMDAVRQFEDFLEAELR
jgi:protein O-GlcNAc transferase